MFVGEDIPSRLCRGCGVAHPIEDFAFKNATSGKRHSRCRACCRLVSQQHYVSNKRAYLERNQRNNPLQREANRVFVTQFLREHPCVKCGNSDPVVLEFNHLHPATKTANICDMIHFRVSRARIQLEIAKCEVLCANCHQRNTTTQSLAHYKLAFGENGQTQFASARMAPDLRNIRIVLQRLREAACVDCGLTDPLVLQFDHLESKTKDIAALVRSACSSQRLINELNKCEVRCANCHRRRTAIQGGWFRARRDAEYAKRERARAKAVRFQLQRGARTVWSLPHRWFSDQPTQFQLSRERRRLHAPLRAECALGG